MEEKKKENPLKHYAMLLAHQMDDEKRLNWENLSPRKEEEILEYGKYLRDEIWKKGYAGQIEKILIYAEEYKTLTFEQHRTWFDE